MTDNKYSESSTEGLEDDETLDADIDDESGSGTGEEDSSKGNKEDQKKLNDLQAKLRISEKRVAELETKATEKVPTPPAPPESTPEAQKVIQQLEALGFTRKGAVDEKIKQIESKIELNAEHIKLGNDYDGSDGRPKYEKGKVESYMRDHAVYDPEVAYKAMNEAELLDWNLKKADAGQKKRPYVEKPGGSGVTRSTDNQITKEKLQEVANNPTPLNREWYERNRNKILQMMAEGQI